jgi:hypothetical protein
MTLRQRHDGWWEILSADAGDALSAWPDRETACRIARLYGCELWDSSACASSTTAIAKQLRVVIPRPSYRR